MRNISKISGYCSLALYGRRKSTVNHCSFPVPVSVLLTGFVFALFFVDPARTQTTNDANTTAGNDSNLNLSTKPRPGKPKKNVSELVTQLGHQQWQKRETAEKTLLKLASKRDEEAEKVLEYCLRACVSKSDPEIRERAKNIVRKAVMSRSFDNLAFLGASLSSSLVRVTGKGRQYHPGVKAVKILDDTPASRAGLESGDVIIKIDDRVVGNGFGCSDLIAYIASRDPGETVKLVLFHSHRKTTRNVKLSKRPEDIDDSISPAQKKRYFRFWLQEKAAKLTPKQ